MAAFDPGRTFRKLACNNALADLRLLTCCAALEPGEFEATRTSFFPSIKATLNHILTVDWFYVDALEGGTLGPRAWQNEAPCATVQALAVEQSRVDQRLVALCDALTADRLVSTMSLHRSGRIQQERVEDVLSHLFQHQTHHRGQVHAMLAGSSVKPPQLDEFIISDYAKCRTEEVAALGWSEEKVMR